MNNVKMVTMAILKLEQVKIANPVHVILQEWPTQLVLWSMALSSAITVMKDTLAIFVTSKLFLYCQSFLYAYI